MGGNGDDNNTSNNNNKMDVEDDNTVPKKKNSTTASGGGGESSSSKSKEEEEQQQHPDMELAQNIHRLLMLSTNQLENDEESALQVAKISIDDLPLKVMNQVGGVGVDGDVDVGDSDAAKKRDGEEDKKKEEKGEKKENDVVLGNPSLYRYIRDHILNTWEGTIPKPELKLLTEDELKSIDSKHAVTLQHLESKVEEAKETAGDMEVLDARFIVARFASQHLSKDDALNSYEAILELPKLSTGKTIDAIMESARVASFHGDTKKNMELVDRAVKMASDGGDWDRRNRLKVYDALSKLLRRDVKGAASLLIDCIATFSCTELCSYRDFIVYTIITNILHLPRTDLKEKIVDGPEILTIVDDIPVVYKLVQSLYDCDYKTYLHTVANLHPILISDRFLQPHAGYILRELHVLGYKQFLDSYKSVTLQSMSQSFGIGTEYLDLQLSRFIAAGRLTAKIDKYGGVVETNRPDSKNAQYREMIQKGDLLLNRIQKLARVVDL